MMDDKLRKDPVVLTREELHAQVWETPMSRLAAEYGISGNGLAKICHRLDIPYPPRGWWAKKAAGKKVVVYRLPPAKPETPLQVSISPTPAPIAPPEPPPEVKQKVEALRAGTASITVSERLLRPHRIVERWLTNHERRREEARSVKDPWRINLAPAPYTPMDRRQHRILDALFKALEARGGKVHEDRSVLHAEISGEKIEFGIREKLKQVRVPLSEDEKRYSYRAEKGWQQELQPTGRLVFSIKTYLPDGLRREWLETDSITLEDSLSDIVAVFLTAGPLLLERTRQRQEEERQRQIAERTRYEDQQRQKREDNRWKYFVDAAGLWEEAEMARRFLDALKQMPADLDQPVGDQTLADWIAWAEARIKANPLGRGARSIFSAIASINEWNYGR